MNPDSQDNPDAKNSYPSTELFPGQTTFPGWFELLRRQLRGLRQQLRRGRLF